jgi:hypothetical protein
VETFSRNVDGLYCEFGPYAQLPGKPGMLSFFIQGLQIVWNLPKNPSKAGKDLEFIKKHGNCHQFYKEKYWINI